MSNKQRKNNSDGQPGSTIGFWLVIGAGIGVAVGVALNSIPIGLAVGVGGGFLISAVFDQRRR